MLSRTLLLALVVIVVAISSQAISAFRLHSTSTFADHFKNHPTPKSTDKVGDWPSTVSSLNASAYLGLWYQVYGNAFVLDTFSNNSYCATATYGPAIPRTDGKPEFKVFNWERQYSITGNVRNITGFAYQPDAAAYPGRLSVTLNGGGANAPYWIFDISPLNQATGQYEWAIVSDYIKLTLFVLARDPQVFQQKYEQEVLMICRNRGFTGGNAPIKIVQSPACNYNQPM